MKDSKIILIQGGNASGPIDKDFFLITKENLKGNFGYIGRRSRTVWRLYTILGRTPMVLGSKENYYHFANFEDCVYHLEALSKCKVEINYNFPVETPEIETPEIETAEVGADYVVRTTSQSILEQMEIGNFTLTPGANYKLELYLASARNLPKIRFSEPTLNGIVFDSILDRHLKRIKYLEDQLEIEKLIIRPEDVPDLLHYNNIS